MCGAAPIAHHRPARNRSLTLALARTPSLPCSLRLPCTRDPVTLYSGHVAAFCSPATAPDARAYSQAFLEALQGDASVVPLCAGVLGGHAEALPHISPDVFDLAQYFAAQVE